MSSTVPVQRVKHRDYAFLGLTQSLCPECYAVVPTKIIKRNNRVYFRKTCSEHGSREDFICSDASRYDLVETSLPAKLPAETFVEPQNGCPYDCGLCSEHEQHTCIGVIEITDGCNLTCPMCYAGSAPGKQHKSFEEIKAAVDSLVKAEGRAEVMQMSGGEPTLHPELVRSVEYALSQPVDYVMINTNGIRFANDEELLEQLKPFQDRLEIYFQFDSLEDEQITQLRGQSGLLETKLRALDRLAAFGFNVTLVATLQSGVNDAAPAELVEFAKHRPEVTGLSFQPATYSGRHVLPEQLEQRITFPDVVDNIVQDPRNEYRAEDFFPLPCAHPNCHWISLAVRGGDGFTPLTKLLDAKEHMDLLANGISFTKQQTQTLAQQVLSRLACSDSGCCTPSDAGMGVKASEQTGGVPLPVLTESANDECCSDDVEAFLQGVVQRAVGARDMLRITITSFLDVYNFDVRRVMKCCTHHVLPSGHIIPFCAYNVLYRNGIAPLPELKSDQ